MPNRPTSPSDARHHVTAVVVAHDGSRWLPDVLAGLNAQQRGVQRLVVADTGSRDTTEDILAQRVGEDSVVRLPRRTGFGAAVARAVQTLDPVESPADADSAGGQDVAADGQDVAADRQHVVEWLWLLHDDSAPEPDALAQLLVVAETSPSAAVLGPKLRGWNDPTALVEVGVTMSGSGRRETGLEGGETDQGQHDGIREVLAVSTAGMLIRRDVFDHLGGFDPRLPMFRDDVDLGWRVNLAGHRVLVVPDAVLTHAEAASHSRRRVDCAPSHRHLTDRRNALYVLLANLPARSLPLAYVRLTVVSLLRSVGFVLTKRMGYAVDELAALLMVLFDPGRVFTARRRRRKNGLRQHRAARHLIAPASAQVRHVFEVVAGVVTGDRNALGGGAGRAPAAETGPVADETENLDPSGSDGLRGLLNRPGLVLFGSLLLVTLVAARGLLWGGTLMGGALLPAPAGASDLWHTYTSSWHDVGPGSGETAPPYLAVLGTLAFLLFGKAGVVVDVLLLGAVPLAGWIAYRALSGVVENRLVRVWAAATYALLPAATGAVAAGRLGTAVGIVLLPILARLALRTVGLTGRPPASHFPWATGALLAVTAAFVPVAYLLAFALAVVVVVTSERDRALWRRVGIVLVVPPLVLLPWTLSLLRDPSRLLLEAGLPGPGLVETDPNPVALALLNPGGPGTFAAVLTGGLLLAALAALVGSRSALAVRGWAVALAALGVGLLMSLLPATDPALGQPATPWPGYPTAVAAAALLVVVATAAPAALDRLSLRVAGWRQPATVLLALLAGLVPVLAAGSWVVRGAGDPLERRAGDVLPANVAAEADTPRHTRTLVLTRDAQDTVRYTVVRDAGLRLGAAETAPAADSHGRLDTLVADIMSARGGGSEVSRLASYAVRYVLVTGEIDPDVVDRLDAVPGLDRVSTKRDSALWQLRGSPSRVMLTGPGGETGAPIPSFRVDSKAHLPEGEPGRLIVLAEQADPGWTATVNGREVRPTVVAGWAQGFEVPESGGDLVVRHEDSVGSRWYVVQGVLAFALLVLAVPGARTEEEAERTERAVTPRIRPTGRRSSVGRGRRRAGRGQPRPVSTRSRRRS